MKLPIDIYSPDALSATIFELTTHTGRVRDAHVSNATKPAPSPALAHILELFELEDPTTATLEKLGKDLEAHLLRAPVAHITLAALPGNATKRDLTTWFRTHISPEVLLTFTARADLGGGIVVQAGSHVYDFSFKRLLLANKARLAEIANV